MIHSDDSLLRIYIWYCDLNVNGTFTDWRFTDPLPFRQSRSSSPSPILQDGGCPKWSEPSHPHLSFSSTS